jgi:hypothetical protein
LGGFFHLVTRKRNKGQKRLHILFLLRSEVAEHQGTGQRYPQQASLASFV